MSPDDDLHFALTALYHARRERDEARERIAELERECDEAAGLMDEAQTTVAQVHREWSDATQERDNANELRDELRHTLHRVAKRVGMAGPLDHWHHDSVEAAIDSMIGTLERERDAWRDDAQRYAANADFWRDRAEAAERERDAARRELAAAKDQGLGASAISSRQAPNSEELDCGSAVASPAPASAPRRCRFVEADGTPSELYEWDANSSAHASAPLSETAPISCAGNTVEIGKARRWWLVVNGNGGAAAFPEAELGMAQFCARRWDEIYPQRAPHSVVPVIEARVTRETVDRIAHETFPTVRPVNNADMRRFARALGLTVEGDDNG